MGQSVRIRKVVDKLATFRDGVDDSLESTPSILRNIANFIENDLDDAISELEDIADEVESLEEEE